LLIEGFAEVEREAYVMLLDWDREARAAGYERPA
jgi:hypothetical protein